MDVQLFDVQCGCGGREPGNRQTFPPSNLLGEMERLGVERALVRAQPDDMEIDIPGSNQHLYENCREHSELLPCPLVAPNGAGDLPDEDLQVEDAINNGAGAVTIRPDTDYWRPTPWCSEELFLALQNSRLPVLCGMGELDYENIADLAGRYTELPLIIVGAAYRSQRILLPLMKTFANVYLSIGRNYLAYRGIEQFVNTIGPDQLLFGTGYPNADMGGPIAQIMYADIADNDKSMIGSQNLNRLIGEVRQ